MPTTQTVSQATQRAATKAAERAAAKAYQETVKRRASHRGRGQKAKLPTTPKVEQTFVGKSIFTQFEMDHPEKMLDAFADKCDVDPSIAGMMRHVFSPKSDPEHLSFVEAAQLYFPDEKPVTVGYRFRQACTDIVAAILFGQSRKEEAETVQNEDTGPKRQYTHRTEAQRTIDEARKAKMKEIRESMGISVRGRIPDEKKKEYDKALKAWEKDTA